MVTFEIQHSGNICPRSGVWSEIETGQLITIARERTISIIKTKLGSMENERASSTCTNIKTTV